MIAFHVATPATAARYADRRDTASGAVDLTGWVVSTRAGVGVAESAVAPAGVELPPGGHPLLAGPDPAGTAAEHVAAPSVTRGGHVLSDVP